MAKNKTSNKDPELYEDPDALVEQFAKTEEFVRRNRKMVTYIGGAIALVIAGIFFYRYYITSQAAEAQQEMFTAVYYFENDSLDMALNGDGAHPGLLAISEDYGMTAPGNLANYYVGVIYLNKGMYDQAIDHLKKFDGDDALVQAQAYALIGDAYMEKGEYKDAISAYDKAADHNSNAFFTPGFLLKKGLAQQKQLDHQGAADTYGRVIDNYPKSSEIIDAKKYRANALASVK